MPIFTQIGMLEPVKGKLNMPFSMPTERRAVAVKCLVGLVISSITPPVPRSLGASGGFFLPGRSVRAKVASLFRSTANPSFLPSEESYGHST